MNIIDTLTKLLGFRPESIVCRGRHANRRLLEGGGDREVIACGRHGLAVRRVQSRYRYASDELIRPGEEYETEFDMSVVTRQVATTPWTDPLEGTIFEGLPSIGNVVSVPVGADGPQSIDMLKVVESLATASLFYDVDLRLEVAHHERTAADGTADDDRVEPRIVLTLRKNGAAP